MACQFRWTNLGNLCPHASLGNRAVQQEGIMGRGILLWLIGVPIPIILLLALVWR